MDLLVICFKIHSQSRNSFTVQVLILLLLIPSFNSFFLFRNEGDIKEKPDYIDMAGCASMSKAGTRSELLPVPELTLTPSSTIKPSSAVPLNLPFNTNTGYA